MERPGAQRIRAERMNADADWFSDLRQSAGIREKNAHTAGLREILRRRDGTCCDQCDMRVGKRRVLLQERCGTFDLRRTVQQCMHRLRQRGHISNIMQFPGAKQRMRKLLPQKLR